MYSVTQLGNEGWFSLGKMIRGRHQVQVRGCVLLDAIWPRGKMNFKDILPAILQLVPSEADAIFFGPRSGIDYGKCSRLIIPRRLEAPTVWVIARKGNARLQVSALDLVIADGDSAWSDSSLGEFDHFWPSRSKYLGGRSCSLLTFGIKGGFAAGRQFYDALSCSGGSSIWGMPNPWPAIRPRPPIGRCQRRNNTRPG